MHDQRSDESHWVHAFRRDCAPIHAQTGGSRTCPDAGDPALSGGEVRFRLVSSDQPYVRLPDRIELTLAEAGELLEVLDVAVATARTDGERATAQGLRR